MRCLPCTNNYLQTFTLLGVWEKVPGVVSGSIRFWQSCYFFAYPICVFFPTLFFCRHFSAPLAAGLSMDLLLGFFL
ncbi:hypothetical protein DM02DRAFT_360269 [Periconia macrospinosa]|uniref:Uncharacterized protein n=1 Tax=Periconia macrospinosa TaxID=97972 RepID=A0A2V1DTK7_9PLEO|nr:hypothetical protein DM02DRAFT_360269 [Periconia macrospinosa]